MTVQDKTTLKGYFNKGDVPNESNYIDLIDSMALVGSTPSTNITTDITNFNNNLSSADDTLQKALDTIDNMPALNTGVTFFIDGGTVVITTGDKLTTEAPYNCNVLSWVVTSSDGTSGSITATIQKISYANFPGGSWTTVATVTLSSATKNSGTLTGQTFSSGDIIKVNVSSATSVKKVAISLKVRKT